VIARWKGIIEEIHFGGSIMPSNIIENLYLEKPSFRPSKWPRKLKPAKNSKLPKLPESCFEPFGKGGWPPISTWIDKIRRWFRYVNQRLGETSMNWDQLRISKTARRAAEASQIARWAEMRIQDCLKVSWTRR
jgi:hypothetical protein